MHSSKSPSPRASVHLHSPSPITTAVQYTVIILVAVDYILTDHPRHIRHRETQRHGQTPASTAPQDRDPSSKSHTSSQGVHQQRASDKDQSSRQRSRLSSSYARPYDPPLNYHHRSNLDIHHTTSGHADKEPCLSKARMSEAWTHMRAVSRHPDNTTKNMDQKPRKQVRWGSVRIYEYESEADWEEKHGSTVNRTGREEAMRGSKMKDRQEIWAPVETMGLHELWGPVVGSDGQLG